ncbi:hypothetical protein FPOAC2_07551 [Fusarium poae]|jgi:hypothetical protein|uniref:hypothetical protein n=1 Tax=Fusarium poae TaxID=36050 RepID=UPI001CE86620|nr:hypothetical protein FPOAC1_007639 [Fusarium poae]KAG8668261.1 hypothetical protein FPOAC1_007639 [Fusarium poae]
MAVTNDQDSVFQRLPNELTNIIFNLLPNRDIKNLRLTCHCLNQRAPLRFNRVFVSANPLNIEVFLAIAHHDTFRHQVKELIWDDATFQSLQTSTDDYDDDFGSEEEGSGDHDYQGDSWFSRRCRQAIGDHMSRLDIIYGNEQRRSLLPSRESLSYYERLFEEQAPVLESRADEEAVRYVLQKSRFPNLMKVTVTPAAHGFLFSPLYETPMIRAFPPGFVYPIPRGWTYAIDIYSPGDAEPWDHEEEKKKWRGVQIMSRLLADQDIPCSLPELSFDNHQLPTGINHYVFDQPNDEYDNLCRILERPGFKRITLSVLMGWLSDQDAQDWDFLKKGRIRNALAKASDLEEITFQTDYPLEEHCWESPAVDTVSLFDIFPIDQWSTGGLKHFGLSGMQVTQEELLSVIEKLSPTLQSIELSFLSFIEGTGNHAGILADIRDKLEWRHRPVNQRIRLRMLVRINQEIGRYTCLDKEINDYLYGDGPPPFGVDASGGSWAMILPGAGMEYDEFDTDYVKPCKRLRDIPRDVEEVSG